MASVAARAVDAGCTAAGRPGQPHPTGASLSRSAAQTLGSLACRKRVGSVLALNLARSPVLYEPTIERSRGLGASRMNRLLSVCFAAALSLLAGSAHHSLLAQDGNPILALRGRWAGIATLTPATGPTVPYKCVA